MRPQIKEIVRLIRQYLLMPLGEQLDVLYILFLHIKAAMLLRLFSSNFIINKYFFKTNDTNTILQPYSKQISLFEKTSKKMPWKISCLIECMVISDYLRKYKCNIPLFLGLKNEGMLIAHAWYAKSNSKGFENNILK